jgi:hypothetical protein
MLDHRQRAVAVSDLTRVLLLLETAFEESVHERLYPTLGVGQLDLPACCVAWHEPADDRIAVAD